jgi:acyl-CoA thioester hydrolase
VGSGLPQGIALNDGRQQAEGGRHNPRPMPTTAAAPPVAYRHTLRVYWEDTDAGGIVFYANYLKYFERARTEWLRHLGVGQQALRDATGAIFVVTDTRVRYRRAARLDDLLEVTVVLKRRGMASMTIAQQAWRGSELLAEGEIRIGCVDQGTFEPRCIPNEVNSLL